MPQLRSRAFALAVLAVLAFTTAPALAGPAPATLADLQAALQGESDAHARYTAFAAKADQEGYPGVASLFRAAAAAEKIHADNHAKVIRDMGGVPAVQTSAPMVGSTRENLQKAIDGETYERDTMYPEFVSRAKQAGLRDAVRTLNLAMTAENEHAKLYQEALGELDSRSPVKTFYVCPTCGYTVAKVEGKKCRSCFEPTDTYVAVR